MNIEHIDGGGFEQYVDNKAIEKIVWLSYDLKIGTVTIRGTKNEADVLKHYGNCTIHFYDKPPKELRDINMCTVYTRQYGTPVSEDGTKLFIGSWEKTINGSKEGLRAYDIETESLLWRLPEGKIRRIFVYPEYLIVERAYNSIIKIDIESGAVLGRIKNRCIEDVFDLGFPYVLVDTLSGNISVIDTERMLVAKHYGKRLGKIINPSACTSVAILNAALQDGKLSISGVEFHLGINFHHPDDCKEFNKPNFEF